MVRKDAAARWKEQAIHSVHLPLAKKCISRKLSDGAASTEFQAHLQFHGSAVSQMRMD